MKTLELQLQSFSRTLKQLFISLYSPAIQKNTPEGIYEAKEPGTSEKDENGEANKLSSQKHLEMILKEVREEVEARKKG